MITRHALALQTASARKGNGLMTARVEIAGWGQRNTRWTVHVTNSVAGLRWSR
jgi:hypothetical protein